MKNIYDYGWPVSPFTRLTPAEMTKLLKTIAQKQREEVGEALL